MLYPTTAGKAYGWHDIQQMRHMHEGVNPKDDLIETKFNNNTNVV